MPELTNGDRNVVSNIRYQFKDQVVNSTDEQIAQCWRDFSQSEDYSSDDKFLEWLADYK